MAENPYREVAQKLCAKYYESKVVEDLLDKGKEAR